MNRRNFLRSTLAAAMMAVASRLGMDGEKVEMPELEPCGTGGVDTATSDCCTGALMLTITATDNEGNTRAFNGPLVYSGGWQWTMDSESRQVWA